MFINTEITTYSKAFGGGQMDFKKIINAALVPTVALVVLGIISTVIGFALGTFLPIVGGIASIILGLVFFVIDCLILGWAGYRAARNYQLDILGAAITGAIAAFISSIINSIISIVLTLIGIIPAATSSSAGAVIGGGAVIVIMLIGLVIGAIISIVIGAVLGAIGGFLGKGKKK